MERVYKESGVTVSPIDSSPEYDFLLATEVKSAEPTPPPGMKHGVSQRIWHGHNIYAFSSENRTVSQWDYNAVKELPQDGPRPDNAEDLEDVITALGESDATTTSYEEFESPIEPYEMRNAIETYRGSL